MGRGDKRSFKGKVFKGSHGKTRPRHKTAKAATPATPSAGGQAKKK
ncbi:MAG TPA: 30S ribosomal protein THX [Usitatibacter sp.]|nr:30S ribosomal protein THX [Usitatibacter sp.]